MASTEAQMKLRLPDGMRDRIAEAAKKNGRSMNAEIVSRLERTFSQENPQSDEIVITMNQFDKIIDDAIQRALAAAANPTAKP